MAFLTSSESFFKDNRISAGMVDELIKYMESHLYIVRIKLMYEWIKQNGGINLFTCSNDMYESLAERMAMNRIPFIIIRDMSDNTGLLIRNKDYDMCVHIKKEILEEKSVPCKIMSTMELIAFSENIDDSEKGVVSITGLTSSQLEMIEDKVMNIIHPEAIGEDLMQDMTYRFSILGKDAFKKEINSLARILLDIQFMTQGPNKGKNTNRAENHRMMDGYISDALSGKRPVSYIVEGKRYMKLSSAGFEYGFIKKINGSVGFTREFDYRPEMPDYEEQLYSKLASFCNAVITTNINEVYNIIDKNSVFILDEKEKERDISEREVSRMITITVRKKMEDDPVMAHEGRYASKMTEMIKEMSRVMKGVLTNTVPLGYTEGEITNIAGAMYRYGLSKDDYRTIPDELSKLEIVPIAEIRELISEKKLEREERRIRDFEELER